MINYQEFLYWDKKFKEELGISFKPIGGGRSGKSKKRKAAQARAVSAQREFEEAAAFTPQELERKERTFGIEEELSDLLRSRLAGEAPDVAPEELLAQAGPISAQALELARRGVEKPEEFFFADVFQPRLDLVQEAVKQQAARRGITPSSGLALEGLGRAGIDLAIQDALGRQRARVLGLQTGLGVGALARGEAAGRRAELGQFLGPLQQLTDRSRQRALGGTQQRTELQTNIGLAEAERIEREINAQRAAFGKITGAGISLIPVPGAEQAGKQFEEGFTGAVGAGGDFRSPTFRSSSLDFQRALQQQQFGSGFGTPQVTGALGPQGTGGSVFGLSPEFSFQQQRVQPRTSQRDQLLSLQRAFPRSSFA